MDVRRGPLIALAACGGLLGVTVAVAQPSGGGDMRPPGTPATWKPLPTMALAMSGGARADGVAIDRADAWGDPARGCYAVRLELSGGSAPPATIATQVIDALAGAGSAAGTVTFSELVKPADGGGGDVVSFAFARAPYRGRARVVLGAGRVAVLACFGNQRDPARCDAACGRMLQSLP